MTRLSPTPSSSPCASGRCTRCGGARDEALGAAGAADRGPGRGMADRSHHRGDRRRAEPRPPPDPLPRGNRHRPVGQQIPGGRKRLGHAEGDLLRLPDRARRRARLRLPAPPLRDAAAHLLPADRRLPGDPDHRLRPDPGRLVRLRDRAQARGGALVCFFPIAVATADGLRAVDLQAVKMLRTLDASRRQLLWRLEMPTALPFTFSGAKIGVTFAPIAAVFGDVVGSDSGLGHLILQDNAQLNTARVFAAAFVLSAIAIGLYGLVALAERRIVTWRSRTRG